MRTPNLNALRMFNVAARHLNFRLAAAELNLTQGAVAQQIRRLESDLGVMLFERKPRGLALTKIGENYHHSVNRALTIINDATQEILPIENSVTVSMPPSFASKWLVPNLASFSALHPTIDVQVVASEQLTDFQSDGVDIAVRQGRTPFGKDLSVELLASLNLCAVCSPGLAEKISTPEQISDLVEYPLIQDSHKLWQVLFEEVQLKPKGKILQFNQTSLAMDAAINGQGIAIAPQILANTDIENNRLVKIWDDRGAERGGYYVVYPLKRRVNSAQKLLIDWMLAQN